MRLSRLSQALLFTSSALMLSACGNDADSNTTVHDVTPPLVTTDSNFADGYSAVAALFLSGTVQDNGGIQSITYQLNQTPAQPLNLDKDGGFHDSILLAAGSNAVTLTATDNAGNIMRITKTLYVGNIVAAGNSHTGALQDGKLYGFGGNNFGQTGLGMTSKIADTIGHPDTPMLMHSAPRNLVAIDFNQNHSLAIAQDGRVYSWGEDKSGQLGRGDSGHNDCTNSKNDCRLDISAIAGIDHAVMLAAGYSHNLVLTTDGSIWAFGANGQGQLGNANLTTAKNSTPVKVDFSAAQGIGRIVQVVASANSSYALDDKGQVWGWGSDAYANLGRGQACTKVNNCNNFNAVPVLINVIPATTVNNDSPNTATDKQSKNPINVEQVMQLAAGKDHVLALTNKDSVYAWGLNGNSQIGYNGIGYKNTEKAWGSVITTPMKLPWFTDKAVRHVYANGNASYVLLDNGTVYPWGMFGETDGTGKTVYNNLNEPTDTLPSLTNIDTMAMGIMHLIAHEKGSESNKNGSLFTWGWSFEGSLGNKDTTHIWMYNNPIPTILPNQL